MAINTDYLFSQTEAAEQDGWVGITTKQILSRFAKNATPFPCLFAKKAFACGMVKFLSVPYLPHKKQYDLAIFSEKLKYYLQSTLTWDGKFQTAYPLLVIFEPMGDKTTNEYQDLFVQSLQYLIDHDDKPWIGEIPKDANKEYWTMCFCGVEIFINVSHPNHLLRKSRNLCDTLVLVINPRQRFDIFAGDNPAGYAIRNQIRDNIDKYDEIPRSPLLGHYLLGELEWPQYMLPETNSEQPMQCPLKFLDKK